MKAIYQTKRNYFDKFNQMRPVCSSGSSKGVIIVRRADAELKQVQFTEAQM